MNQTKASLKVLKTSHEERFPYTISAGRLKITVHKNVFSPRHFNGWRIFHRLLPSLKGKDVLEIGTGTAAAMSIPAFAPQSASMRFTGTRRSCIAPDLINTNQCSNAACSTPVIKSPIGF